jgi:ribA/ribD-fused uncharacterized protein
MIDLFRGEYAFLSNFYPCIIEINGYKFKSSEAAYQAAKSEDPIDWARFQHYDASTSKKQGGELKLRPDWDEIKLDVMRQILVVKFVDNRELLMALLATRPHELVEGNWWGDRFWGVCSGQGQNQLGKLLMELRERLQGDLPW